MGDQNVPFITNVTFNLCAAGLLIIYLISTDTLFITGTAADLPQKVQRGKIIVDPLQLPQKKTEGGTES